MDERTEGCFVFGGAITIIGAITGLAIYGISDSVKRSSAIEKKANTILRVEDVNKDGIEDRVMCRAEKNSEGYYTNTYEEVLFGVRTADGRILYVPKEQIGEYAEKPSQK